MRGELGTRVVGEELWTVGCDIEHYELDSNVLVADTSVGTPVVNACRCVHGLGAELQYGLQPEAQS